MELVRAVLSALSRARARGGRLPTVLPADVMDERISGCVGGRRQCEGHHHDLGADKERELVERGGYFRCRRCGTFGYFEPPGRAQPAKEER